MVTVNVREAKTHLSRLLERAHAGEEVVIAKNGKPYARLVALAERPQRRPGLLQGVVGEEFFEPLPAEDLGPWHLG